MTIVPYAVLTRRRPVKERQGFLRKWLLVHAMREYYPPVTEEGDE